MKKKFIKYISLAITTGLLVMLLSACGGTKDTNSVKENDSTKETDSARNTNSTKSNEPSTPKEAFEQEGIWFHSYKVMIAKDVVIDYILVFDGNGNVTHYRTQITFADLRDLSEEEIIELAKEQDKAMFERDIQELLSALENAGTLGYSYPYNSEEEYHEFLNEAISRVTEVVYKEPEAYPFTLKIETDGSGNNTSNETLTYSYTRLSIFWGDEFYNWLTMDELASWEFYREENGEIDLFPAPGNMTVYDMQFNGFGELSLMVEEGHLGFTLDTPETEGIQVD